MSGPPVFSIMERSRMEDCRMRPSKFTEDEIVGALRQVRDGTPAVQICRQLGITETTFYRWRSKHNDLGRIEPREMRDLRDENQKLRQIVANLLLDQQRSAESRRKK
jgi:putative transposase